MVRQTKSVGPQGPHIPLAVGWTKPGLGDRGSIPVQPPWALVSSLAGGPGMSPWPGPPSQPQWHSGLAAPVVQRGQAAALLCSGAFLPFGDYVMENICPR